MKTLMQFRGGVWAKMPNTVFNRQLVHFCTYDQNREISVKNGSNITELIFNLFLKPFIKMKL